VVKDTKPFTNGQGIISVISMPVEDATAQDYIVALANKTKDYTVTMIKVKEDGVGTKLPSPVGFNCDLPECADCTKQGKFDSILYTTSEEPPFDLWVFAHTDNPDKPSGWGGPVRITPTSDYGGSVVCLDIK